MYSVKKAKCEIESVVAADQEEKSRWSAAW